jgi:hypothetical protein
MNMTKEDFIKRVEAYDLVKPASSPRWFAKCLEDDGVVFKVQPPKVMTKKKVEYILGYEIKIKEE